MFQNFPFAGAPGTAPPAGPPGDKKPG
jgi:hypothetical protein